jgi:hypothetical protein
VGIITVRTQLLAAVAKWTYIDDTRPNLNVVYFDGKAMIATDGHRMVVVPMETSLPGFGIHRRDCAAIAAGQRELERHQHMGELRISVADRKATIALDREMRTMTVPAHGVDYPPYESLFKSLKAETPVPSEFTFNPRYLAAIDEVMQGVDPTDYHASGGVRVKAWSAVDERGFCGPMLFEGAGIQFLVMPMRGS